jgi:hypothetical protein
MQAMFSNFFKNPMIGGAATGAAGLPPPGIPPIAPTVSGAASLMPGPSSSSVPPTGAEEGGLLIN